MKITEKEKNQLIKELISKSGVNIPDLGKELILSWEEVKEMSNSGITFGAHTVTHAILTKVPLAQARYEILQSKKEIEEKIGRPVSAFSYPYGGFEDLNDEIINLLKESGFICAVTCIPKTVHYKVNPYKLGRILPEVKSGCDLNHFKLMLLVSRLYTGITLSRAGGK
jgi:peptidoglycan/xylan/chitin deacetylase (PgdA/CDA1 family)